MKREWEIRPADPQAVSRLSRELSLPEMLARLLVARGLSDLEQARAFLLPRLADLADPSAMKGMDAAVERLLQAGRQGERITIWGDYDVDGVTSVSLLLLFLRRLGFTVDYYIPSRLEEGYGLNSDAVQQVIRQGTQLLVTVDCGISDYRQVEEARQAGVQVLIIDHHQVPEEIPQAVAVLDPHRLDCPFPQKEAAAVGVTFYLLMALRARLRRLGRFEEEVQPNLRELLDLVALGTVADVVPLTGDNRILAHFGLQELTAGRRPGIAALKEVAGLFDSTVTAGQVAFRLAPRINAVGRLGRAGLAVELLTTDSYARALQLARELDQANSERQAIEQRIFLQALERAERAHQRGDPALVLWSDDWHIGVVGIVASRLVERFGCPALLVALDGEMGKGSARSVEGVHLFRALEECKQLLEAYGGHRAAAGLSIRRENLEDFRREFTRQVLHQLDEQRQRPQYWLDGEVAPGQWTPEMIQALGRLQPFGLGNPEPVFLARGLEVASARLVGRDGPNHLKLAVRDGQRSFDAIGFTMSDRLPEARGRIDLAYTPQLNSWDGGLSIQLRIRDLRPHRD